MDNTIKELSKVTLELSVAESGQNAAVVSFIYGLETEGLTPFEGLLANKKVGDSLVAEVKPSMAAIYFGKVLSQVRPLLVDGAEDCSLKIVVMDVKQADNREVVQALAGQVSHCGSGDCGCGCS